MTVVCVCVCVARCASLQEQLFLRAVIAEFRRLGLEEATFQQVKNVNVVRRCCPPKYKHTYIQLSCIFFYSPWGGGGACL